MLPCRSFLRLKSAMRAYAKNLSCYTVPARTRPWRSVNTQLGIEFQKIAV